MNAADDRTQKSSPAPGSLLLRCSVGALVLIACFLAIFSGMSVAMVQNNQEEAVRQGRQHTALDSARTLRSVDEKRSESDSGSEERASQGDDENAGSSVSSSSDDLPGQPAVQAAVPAVVMNLPSPAVAQTPTNPTAVVTSDGGDQGFPVPDIFDVLPFLAGVGDIPEIPDGPVPDNFGNANLDGDPPRAVPDRPDLANCREEVMCKPVRVMPEPVNFVYESILNVLYEISSATIPIVINEINNIPDGQRECSDTLSLNATHAVLAVRHGTGDARITVQFWPHLSADGTRIQRKTLYTTGEFAGFGQLRNLVEYDRTGMQITGQFQVRFPNAQEFVSFPIIVQVFRQITYSLSYHYAG